MGLLILHQFDNVFGVTSFFVEAGWLIDWSRYDLMWRWRWSIRTSLELLSRDWHWPCLLCYIQAVPGQFTPSHYRPFWTLPDPYRQFQTLPCQSNLIFISVLSSQTSEHWAACIKIALSNESDNSIYFFPRGVSFKITRPNWHYSHVPVFPARKSEPNRVYLEVLGWQRKTVRMSKHETSYCGNLRWNQLIR